MPANSAPPQGYRERPALVSGAVLWTRTMAGDSDTPVLPDGSMDLLWIDGELFVAGPDTTAHHPSAAPHARIAGIRFYPGSAPALLGFPAHEIRDRRVELADMWSAADTRRAAEIVATASSPAIGLEQVARWRSAVTDPGDPILRRIVTELRAGSAVSALADSLELGPRRLHRMSLSAFGYGPKTLARVLRMQRALALARAGVPFADTAARTGYSDQAHLARDIRDLSGMPLSRLLRA
ncbi:helix-turn-helix domain-containing protein [Nocardia jejuensis]|uniref:helix-turn-helix domain-containing protein n=1 Tax=Nocardia jejuensis TaxID=328049 RepID=UPI00082DF728|nr:helix-turn-helix domain-containing protein [Nocardia jejuensis]